MGEDVVGDDQIGGVPVRKPPGGVAPEKRDFGRMPVDRAPPATLAGGLDPEHRNAAVLEVLQQVAVVAGDLDHQGCSHEPIALGHPLGIVAAMVEPDSE